MSGDMDILSPTTNYFNLNEMDLMVDIINFVESYPQNCGDAEDIKDQYYQLLVKHNLLGKDATPEYFLDYIKRLFVGDDKKYCDVGYYLAEPAIKQLTYFDAEGDEYEVDRIVDGKATPFYQPMWMGQSHADFHKRDLAL